ncbi:MAG: translation initiation factor IF-3 [Candidatus Zixiibacteriota bacterium]
MDTREALQLAQNAGLDLVEISPTARPPVCRILDFGKYQYEEAKNQKKAKKRQQSTQLKEMRYRPKIDEHDINFKTNRLREFLQDGHKVRAYVEFRGREMTHTEFGYRILERIKEMLADVGQPESSVRMEGRRMSLIIDPKKGAVKPKKEQPKQEQRSRSTDESSGDGAKPAAERASEQKAQAETPEEVTANQKTTQP